MVGKQWSPGEERFFWKKVVPRSPKRLGIHRLDSEESWDTLADMMQNGMGTEARRKYTGLSLFEHWFQNVVLSYVSKHAVRYAAEYKNNMSPEEKTALERRQDDRARRPRTTKAKRDRAALAVTKAREKADTLRRRSAYHDMVFPTAGRNGPPQSIPVTRPAAQRKLPLLPITRHNIIPSSINAQEKDKPTITRPGDENSQKTGSRKDGETGKRTGNTSHLEEVTIPGPFDGESELFVTDKDTNLDLFECEIDENKDRPEMDFFLADNISYGNKGSQSVASSTADLLAENTSTSNNIPDTEQQNKENIRPACQEATASATPSAPQQTLVAKTSRITRGPMIGSSCLGPLQDITPPQTIMGSPFISRMMPQSLNPCVPIAHMTPFMTRSSAPTPQPALTPHDIPMGQFCPDLPFSEDGTMNMGDMGPGQFGAMHQSDLFNVYLGNSFGAGFIPYNECQGHMNGIIGYPMGFGFNMNLGPQNMGAANSAIFMPQLDSQMSSGIGYSVSNVQNHYGQSETSGEPNQKCQSSELNFGIEANRQEPNAVWADSGSVFPQS